MRLLSHCLAYAKQFLLQRLAFGQVTIAPNVRRQTLQQANIKAVGLLRLQTYISIISRPGPDEDWAVVADTDISPDGPTATNVHAGADLAPAS